MSTTCARCGLPIGRGGEYWVNGEKRHGVTCQVDDTDWEDDRDVIACRDRELANLHSLLRSVTRELEEAAELLEDMQGDAARAITARRLIESVLEVLS